MGDHPLNKAMNACALCGQCTVVCPKEGIRHGAGLQRAPARTWFRPIKNAACAA